MTTAAPVKTARPSLKLEEVRISFPTLFEPRSQKGDDGKPKKPEYSATFILDKKKHAALIKKVIEGVNQCASDKWGKLPKGLRSPLRDGSEAINKQTDELREGYSDAVMFVAAKSQARPQVVMRDRTPAEPEDIYPGCYVNTVITFYAWEHKQSGKGVSVNLGPVQFVRTGERLGGSATIKAEDAFEEMDEEEEEESLL